MPNIVGCSPEHPRYVAGCNDCNAYARQAKAAQNRRKASGKVLPPVPIAEIRPHCVKLRDEYGWTAADIAREALVSLSLIEEVVRKPSDDPNRTRTLQGANAARILAVEPRPLFGNKPRAGTVDALITRRMIRALAAMGHGMQNQARTAGLSTHQVMAIARGEIKHVKQDTADRVAALYAEWNMLSPSKTTGNPAAARGEARAKGWHDPLAWHDITDPACEPETYDEQPRRRTDVDWANVRHALAGNGDWQDLTHAERVIVVTQLSRRENHTGIGRLLHTTPGSIGAFASREGIAPAPSGIVTYQAEATAQLNRYTAPAGTPVRRRFDSIGASDAVLEGNRQRKAREVAAA